MAAAKKTATAKAVDTKAAEAVEALEVKVEAPKAEEIKSEAETTTVQAPVKETVKKAAKTVAKAAEKKKAVKKPAETKPAKAQQEEAAQIPEETVSAVKNTSTKKTTLKANVYLQFDGKSYSEEDLLKMVRDVWQYDLNKKVSEIKSVEMYVKPEEKKAYFVINTTEEGSFDI